MRKKDSEARKSSREIARLAGVSRQRVQVLLAQGRSPENIIEGCIQRRAAMAAWQNDQQSASHGGGPDETFSAALCRKEIAAANRYELEVAQKRASLVEIATVNAWFGRVLDQARVVIPTLYRTSLVMQLRSAPDEASARLLLDAECRAVMEDLGRYAQLKAKGVRK